MRRASDGRRRLRPLVRSPRRVAALLVLTSAAATVLMVHLFPAAAENPRSGRLEIAEGPATAPGVYVGGDDLTGPAVRDWITVAIDDRHRDAVDGPPHRHHAIRK